MNHAKEKVSGEIDFEFFSQDIPKRVLIPDLKVTAKIPSTIKAQLGGYAWLYGMACEVGCIHAPIDGRPKWVPYKAAECIEEWERILKDFKKIRRIK